MARIYDLVMTHKLDTDDLFLHRVQFHCAQLGLNFFLIEPAWVGAFLDRLASGEIWARVLLNMHSEHHRPEDPFTRLVHLAASQHTQVIDPPDVALAAFDKAKFHQRLLGTEIRVPYTVVVPGDKVEGFRLTEEVRAELGQPFVIKPSLGYGRRGVIINASSEADLLKSAADWPGSDYLLQKLMVPRTILETPGYFRVYFAFGKIWCNWWNCYTDRSRPVTPEDREKWGLHPLEDIVRKLAELSQMKFFSTEILLASDGSFVVIDYINDQCHMLSQSANPQIGVPDEVVAGIAERLVQGAQELIRGAGR